MKIHTKTRDYTVLARPRGAGAPYLLARDADGVLFLLLTVQSPEAARQLSPTLLDYGRISAFTDFAGAFPHEGGLCVAFRHRIQPGDRPLLRAAQDAPPRLRAALLRALLAALMEQNPPWGVMCGLLTRENLYCSPTGEARFFYRLALRPEEGGTARAREAMCKLAVVARALLDGIPLPPLRAFLHELESGGFDTVREVYAAFLPLCESVSALPPPEPEEPRGLWVRGQALLAAWSGRVTAWTAALLLAAGYLLLAWSLYRAVFPPPADYGLDQIWTVITNEMALR